MVCFLTAEQPVNKKRKIKNKKEKDAACNKEEKENKLKEKKVMQHLHYTVFHRLIGSKYYVSGTLQLFRVSASGNKGQLL